MRRPIIVVFFSLFLMAFQALATERGALFKVSASGHSLYLYGTIHAGRAEFYPLEPRIGTALAGAPTLVLEIDTGRDPASMAAAFQKHGLFAAGSPGYAGLPPERRQRIEAALKQQGIEPAAVAPMKPWMLLMMLAMSDLGKLGYSPEFGVDGHLAGLARSRNIRIGELETVEYQAALLGSLSLEEQWSLLEEALEDMASGRQLSEARELFDAYERADQAALDRIVRRMEADDSLSGKFLRKVVWEERNGPMADKVGALLARENNAVVAVGLLHLLGKQGIPELLRKRGVKVERIY